MKPLLHGTFGSFGVTMGFALEICGLNGFFCLRMLARYLARAFELAHSFVWFSFVWLVFRAILVRFLCFWAKLRQASF
jgi:hypothetical protein